MSGVYTLNRENARWRIVGGEAVIINLSNTYYYGLNRTGTFVWNLLLDRDREFDELVAEVARRYGQPPDAISDDVRSVLDELAREQLVSSRGPI